MVDDRDIQHARRHLGLDRLSAVLGTGVSPFQPRTADGQYWVRKIEAGTLSLPIKRPLKAGVSMPIKDGQPCELGRDEKGREVIFPVGQPELAAAGINALTVNPGDTVISNPIRSDDLQMFKCTRHGDTVNKPLTVVVFVPPVVLDDGSVVLPIVLEADFTGNVPGAGLRGYAVVFWLDTNSLEVQYSTPVSMLDPLTNADLEEAIAASTAGSIPVWAWLLQDDQTELSADPAKNIDLRQFVNMATGAGGGSMDDFTVAADTGTPETVSDGDTLTIAGGTGLSSVVSATDTVTVNLDNTAVTPGSYTNTNLTVDAQGRITAASNGTDADTGITQLTGDVTAGPGSGSQAATLANSGVSAGSYTNASVTFDAKGRATAASSGATPAPVGATYIVQTADGTLTNEQALSSLSTGLMKVTTTTGVVSSITDSAGLAGVISDETGSGALVFATSPTLTAPTIADFTNAQHDHLDADDAGTLSASAIASGQFPTARLADAFKLSVISAADANVNIASAPSNVDSLLLTSGQRILLTAQTTPSQNGIWVFNGSGSALTRPTDYANGNTVQAFYGMVVFCGGGTKYGGSFWYENTTGTLTIDTSTTTWLLLHSAARGELHLFDASSSNYFNISGTPTGVRVIGIPDADLTIVGVDTAQTLTNKTLTAPTIADFTNANHDHLDADDAGTLSAAAIASGTISEDRLPKKFAIVVNQQSQGVAAANTVANTWTVCPVNTEVVDADGLVTISSNQLTLLAGTYKITAYQPIFASASSTNARFRLRNMTDSTTLLTSQNHSLNLTTAAGFVNGSMIGIFTVAASKALEVQYYSTSAQANGLGRALNVTGEVEWYLYVLIELL